MMRCLTYTDPLFLATPFNLTAYSHPQPLLLKNSAQPFASKTLTSKKPGAEFLVKLASIHHSELVKNVDDVFFYQQGWPFCFLGGGWKTKNTP